MGNICPCLRATTHVYHQVPQNSLPKPSFDKNVTQIALPINSPREHSLEIPETSNRPSSIEDDDLEDPDVSTELEYDQEATPFKGCEVLQKFNNNHSYTKRFVWLNSSSRTIHMSQHMTKERRHKEASLADVTSVVAGPPAKSKGQPGNDILGDLCLTVNFKRGGGIDLQFKSKEDRDVWYNTLLKIVAEFDRNKT